MDETNIHTELYTKLAKIVPRLRSQIGRARRNPMANVPIAVSVPMELVYFEEKPKDKHIVGIVNAAMREGSLRFNECLLMRVSIKEKTAEVLSIQNTRTYWNAYYRNEDKEDPAPLKKYLNEYLAMRLDDYLKRNVQLDFSHKTSKEVERSANDMETPMDEIENIRMREDDQSKDQTINR